MMRRILMAGAALVLAACASAADAPPPAAPPPPASVQDAAPPPAPAAGVAAQGVEAPPAPRPDPPRGDIVVPGQVDRQVQPPAGDPRTNAQRADDIRRWDRCVMQAQNMGESDPTRPVLDTPEDICRRSLGMANRTSAPDAGQR